MKLLFLCAFLLSSLEAIGRTPNVLLRGSGVLTKFVSPSPHTSAKNFVAVVALNEVGNDKLRIGYKAVFPDGSVESLSLEVTDSLDEKSARLYTKQTDNSIASDSIVEIEGGYHILFKDGDKSLLELIITFEEPEGNHGMPDFKVEITTNEWSTSKENPKVSNWKIKSRLDYNALIRRDDNSYEELIEELFNN